MICRDVEFWDDVARHHQVSPSVFMGLAQVSTAPLVRDERNLPLASQNGGLIFVASDSLGFSMELHTLYRPEGWGREVTEHARECFREVMKTVSLVTTFEQEGEKQTRPPLSYGWRSAGDFMAVGLPKRLKLWILTREAWVASPVGRKLCLL
jgi:hypothetical protein